MKKPLEMFRLMMMKNAMSNEEKDILLSELMCVKSKITEGILMSFLLNNDFNGFRECVRFITGKDENIRDTLA